MKTQRKLFLKSYAMSMAIVYIVLVLRNAFSKVYENAISQNIGWIILSDITSLQGVFTIISLGLFLTLILRDRIIRDFIFPFGMFFSFLVMGINNALWNLEERWYESMLSLLLHEQNWLAVIVGAFIFLFYYKKFKRVRR
ncbi:MAG: hypothetical protein V1678_00950 [Candidatus Aenigmatarchaeota archaeon]